MGQSKIAEVISQVIGRHSSKVPCNYHCLLQIWCMSHPEPSMTLDGDVLTAIMAIENYKIFDMNTHLWDEPEKERLRQSGKFLSNSDFTSYPSTICRSILWIILSIEVYFYDIELQWLSPLYKGEHNFIFDPILTIKSGIVWSESLHK